ncbi:MAG TPA: DUF1549 and DUF1553 domain-containing protein, partial [Candidatus Limnocylindria bacterium]|nr:DUF1549 and DUF1553 domain-containing protein [Candidatus Limnocylindria bacterium]
MISIASIRVLRRSVRFAAEMGFLLLVCGSHRSFAVEEDAELAKERLFWSFQKPATPQRPQVHNKRWPRQELDYFVLSRLESKALSPSDEAEKATLIRRVTFDLTGLPPTPQEVSAFLKDKRRDAYERVVNRVLASPRFGERMASLWLPLARYAEDQAHQVGSDTKFFYPNAYKYRDWIIAAFNRDLPYDQFIQLQLAADKLEHTNDLAALGFLGLGPKYYNRGRLDVMADEWEDRVDTVTRTFLGLTVACARCHDHKFDPISREDYYAMAGVFASTRMVNKVPGGAAPKEDNSEEPAKNKMDPATLHIVEDDKPQDLNVFIRGNVERKGKITPRRFVRVLSDESAVAFTNGSGRVELAAAIASPHNPLTSRVMVNRVWGMFFGKPIVDTPSNFGHSGNPPSDPALLDFLATRFVQQGWSVKALVREIVLSATYQQDSRSNVKNAALDSSNESLWRMNRRRLSIEQWRDTLLFVTGGLDLGSGPSLELDATNNFRRTVHSRVSRLQLNGTLMQFDYPDANVHAEKRATTTTATQKLYALNSRFMIERAKALAAHTTTNQKESDRSRVERVYA